MLFWEQLSQEHLLLGEDGEEEEEEGEEMEEESSLRQVNAATPVTYYLAGGQPGEREGEKEKGETSSSGLRRGGRRELPGSSAAAPPLPLPSSLYPRCCHAPASAFYAIIGLSRCWWQYTVTSPPPADAMEEGVATEMRGGTPVPEVTEVGWSLPCSLSSLLAMNCRARAEELARRLQARVKAGGGTQALEHTSLVAPHSDGPYASMECRHSSLDNPHLDSLEDHNLRPIHVVTSEPTIHLRIPSPPLLDNLPLQEQDSDVYYDFDLASPDEVADEEVNQVDDEKASSIGNGERPESGCVTSMTSPLMFDDEADEDAEGDANLEGPLNHFSPQEGVVCSPDADLRAVRHILSSSSLTENPNVSAEDWREIRSRRYKRFSRKTFENESDRENVNRVAVVGETGRETEEISDDKGSHSATDTRERNGGSWKGLVVLPKCDSEPSEGASDGVDIWQHQQQQQQQQQQQHQHQWSEQVRTMPVANSGACWCHTTGAGTDTSAERHLPTSSSPSPADDSDCDQPHIVVNPGYSDCGDCPFEDEAHNFGGEEGGEKVLRRESKEEEEEDVPVMTDQDEVKRRSKKGARGVDSSGRWSRGRGEKVPVVTSPTNVQSSEDLLQKEKVECELSVDDQRRQNLKEEEEEEEKKKEEEEEEVVAKVSQETSSEQVTAAAEPQAISGTTPPQLLAQTHLYVPSEGQQPAADMEARTGSEGDLYSKDEVFCEDSDSEVIETLADEEGEDEENEEDIEEEVILTGKFRNIRGYTERVRRLSDEAEDRHPPPVVIKLESKVVDPSSPLQTEKSIDLADEDNQVSSLELASQLSQLDLEAEGEVEVEEGQEEGDDESTPAESRSSSEEVDPARIEDFKMRIKRSSSLKCGKTPPGTPGRKKIVRFADVLGLDLAAVKTFLAGVPHVPRSAFWDLEVDREAAAAAAAAKANPEALNALPHQCVPRRVLTPLFQQPGCHPDFIDRVRHQKVVIENVVVGDDLSVRGVVRVLSLHFHKSVTVRYTFDQWRNYHETTATYVPNSHDGATDRFTFLLWGSFLQDNAALNFCVRYCSSGQEFWDNNYGRNYTLQCYTSMGMIGDPGTGSPRPQNSSAVQQEIFGHGGSHGGSGGHSFNSFGSPVTPHDPWTTRFF